MILYLRGTVPVHKILRGVLGGILFLAPGMAASVAGGSSGVALAASGSPVDWEDGPKGFPAPSVLESVEEGSGEGPSAHRSTRKPVNSSLGPGIWSQEGGGETRNPYFAVHSSGVPAVAGTPEEKRTGEEDSGGGVPDVTGEWVRHFGHSPLDRLNYVFFHQPLVVSGRVIVSSTRGRVLCLDAVTGSTLWEAALPESVFAPAVADGRTVYLASGVPYVTAPHMLGYAQTRTIRRGDHTGHLYALSLETGKLLWSAPVPGPVLGSPVLEGGLVWLATGAGRLAGYDVTREKKTLEMALASSSGWSSPLFVHHWLWLSLEGPTKLLALWPEKKRTVWALSAPPEERLVLFTPTPSFGAKRLVTLFRVLQNGVPAEHMSIVSAVTGNVFHEIPFSGESPSGQGGLPSFARVYEGMAGAVVSGETAVAASGLFKSAMAVDIPSGRLFWSAPLSAHPTGPGTLVGGLYVLPVRGAVEFFVLATGRSAGRLPFSGTPAAGSPPVVGETLYLSGRDGFVRAVSLDIFRRTILPRSPGTGGTQAKTAGTQPQYGETANE